GQDVMAAMRDELVEKGVETAPDNVRSLNLVRLSLTADVTTPHNGGVFWSGGGDKAGAVAQQLAEERTPARQPGARLEVRRGGSRGRPPARGGGGRGASGPGGAGRGPTPQGGGGGGCPPRPERHSPPASPSRRAATSPPSSPPCPWARRRSSALKRRSSLPT